MSHDDEIGHLKTVILALAETIEQRQLQINGLDLELRSLRSETSGLRANMHNIRGMAIQRFPELERVPDQYECIRQCFLRMRPGGTQ